MNSFQGLVGAVFEGIGVSLGSFVGGYLFQSIGGSATFRLFSMGASVCLVVHVVVQKVYARFAGSFGKSGGGDGIETDRDRPTQVVYMASGGEGERGRGDDNKTGATTNASIGQEDEKASRVLLVVDDLGMEEVPLNHHH